MPSRRWRCFNFSITCLAHTWILCVDMPATSLEMLREKKKSKRKKMPCNAHCCYPQLVVFVRLKDNARFLFSFWALLFLLDIFCHSWSTHLLWRQRECNLLSFGVMRWWWEIARSIRTTHKISSFRHFHQMGIPLAVRRISARESHNIQCCEVRRVGENQYKWIFVCE